MTKHRVLVYLEGEVELEVEANPCDAESWFKALEEALREMPATKVVSELDIVGDDMLDDLTAEETGEVENA